MLKGVLFQGSTRARRVGPKVAAAVASRLKQRGQCELTVIDPRTWEDSFFMRLLEKPLFHYKAGETVPEPLQYTGELLAAADFIVVVTPEMNHSIAPGLVSCMSHFGSSHYQFKPSGVVTYSAGMWGGARAGVALRPFLSELGCLPVSSMVAVPSAIKAMGGVVGDEWVEQQELDIWTAKAVESLGLPEKAKADDKGALPEMSAKMLDRMLDQLEWQARTNRDARLSNGPPSASYFEQVKLGLPTK